MELERRFIERTDFSAARRGYDPEEVDRHLREVADAAEQAADVERASDSLGSLAAEQIRTIVEAAEISASDIRTKAEADAEKRAADADRDASETRKSAETEAAGHVQRVQDATGEMTKRAEAIDSELDSLMSGLRATVSELTDRLRREAAELSGQLEELREHLSEIRAAAPVESATTSVGAAGGSATTTVSAVDEDAIEEVEAEEAEVAHQAATEEEPELVLEEEEELEVVEALGKEESGVDEPGLAEASDGAGDVDEPGLSEAGREPVPAASGGEGSEGARLIALNMALNGTPRDETARYLEENFDLDDQGSILDEVYARAGG